MTFTQIFVDCHKLAIANIYVLKCLDSKDIVTESANLQLLSLNKAAEH